ncbi:ISAzo13-like element transposase-related protein [Succinimonas amylolytica]|uniref:ISAzo13-like element transposase-related protein n=1 Tax=Succinimonas amylolytica TaxID=83769 RepID=UPI0012FC5C63
MELHNQPEFVKFIYAQFLTCVVDPKDYPNSIKISDEELNKVNLSQEEWYGEWNYIIKPNSDDKCKD